MHYHVLALDGVYVREAPDAPLVFHALPEPSAEDVAGQPLLRIVDPSRTRDAEPFADVMGFNVHAQVAIPARDRARLERLCR